MSHIGNTPAHPKLVFKILSATDWRGACATGAFQGSPDDLRDGYIHLSCSHQLKGTLHKYFRGTADSLLVAFEAAALGPLLRFERSRGGDLFPHLYAPLPTAAALWQRPLHLDAEGIPIVPEDVLSC